MNLQHIESDHELGALTQMLKRMRAQEKIPASHRRAAIRARLLAEYPEIKLTVVPTRVGYIGLAWSVKGVVALRLPAASAGRTLRDLQIDFPTGVVVDAPPEIVRELQEYAAGRNREFHIALDLSSLKPFQRAVLLAAQKIPFGETRSYGWIAQQIGKPRASRAVGQALHHNPIPIILPCHRVTSSDGGLGGYAGGLPLKRKLLALEGART